MTRGTPSLLRTVIVDSDAEARMALRRMLARMPSVVIVGECPTAAEASNGAGETRPDLLVVEVPRTGASVIEGVARTLPEAAILATGENASADFVLQVIRAGALEFLSRPVQPDDLAAAVDKVMRLRRGAAPERRMGRVISVFSTKGGLGTTTVAVNLAVCMVERESAATILIELDRRPSDAVTLLDLRPRYSVVDAFENIERLDAAFLHGLLSKHDSGVYVLPGPRPTERAHISAEQLRVGLEIVRSHFDQVVLDLAHDLDAATVAALELSDTVLFLTSLDVLALRSAAAGLTAFRRLGVDPKKVKIVVTRDGSSEDVTVKHVEETLGVSVYWKTPSDYPAVVASINTGQPVVTAAPRSKIGRNLKQLADSLSGEREPGRQALPKRAATMLGLAWNARRLSRA